MSLRRSTSPPSMVNLGRRRSR
uniref:Uncharacterized protein n=1 Tax=Arundo donax TaxID=35708 RepID=A0A0A9HD21_ARUDO